MNPSIDFSQLPLRDIHLPDAVSWWPPAPGWWLLAALVLAGLAVVALRYYRERRRRAALRGLRAVRAALDTGAEPVRCLQQVSMLLRRFAMTAAAPDADRPAEVAGLVGERWLAYLDSSWDRDAFRRGPGRLLLAGPYGRPDTVTRADVAAVADLVTQWLRTQPAVPLLPRRAGVPAPAAALSARERS
jgi:hypothetical protein